MIVTTTMRIAIEVAMILMVTMVMRMTMMIAIKVPMILMIAMVQWQGQTGSLNRLWQMIFAFLFNFVSNQL